MMLTPKQAAAIWCPMVRAARVEDANPSSLKDMSTITVVAGCNTDALGRNRVPASCRCIADQCAMWRWGEFRTTTERKIVPAPERGPGSVKEIDLPVQVPTRGYCGLAGAPVIGGAA